MKCSRVCEEIGRTGGYHCANLQYLFLYIITYKTLGGAENDRLPPHKQTFISAVYILPARAVSFVSLSSQIKSHHNS